MTKRMRGFLAATAVAGAVACFPSSCVARGSRVRTPTGLRPIEELGIGDEVLCLDPLGDSLVPSRLIATRSAQRECVRLTFEGGSLTLTSDHPVYCPEHREWAPAGDWALRKRTHLLLRDGETAKSIGVQETSTFVGLFEVFDLTVDHDLHNFLAEGILVHNKSPPPRPCVAADGGTVYEYEACACPGGEEGYIECTTPDAPVCVGCADEISDAGTSDAGTSDAGTSDAGTSDAGTSDAGTSDAGTSDGGESDGG